MKKRQKIRTAIILCTFFVFPAIYYYLSPYLIIDATGNGIINGSFIIFILLFLSSLFWGRAYCGWVCPAAGCQEFISVVRNKRITRGDFVKWLLWIPWITAIIALAVRRGGYQVIDFTYQTTWGLSIATIYAFVTYLGVLSLIVVPAFIIGKRSFCHHVCWMAPFMIAGRKIKSYGPWPCLSLAGAADTCTHCHTCTYNCPMSLPVEDMVARGSMLHSECILCGTCIDGCKSRALDYTFTA